MQLWADLLGGGGLGGLNPPRIYLTPLIKCSTHQNFASPLPFFVMLNKVALKMLNKGCIVLVYLLVVLVYLLVVLVYLLVVSVYLLPSCTNEALNAETCMSVKHMSN